MHFRASSKGCSAAYPLRRLSPHNRVYQKLAQADDPVTHALGPLLTHLLLLSVQHLHHIQALQVLLAPAVLDTIQISQTAENIGQLPALAFARQFQSRAAVPGIAQATSPGKLAIVAGLLSFGKCPILSCFPGIPGLH